MTGKQVLTLAEQASLIVKQLRAHGFSADDLPTRPALTLVEEAGEFVGAYRRWSGQARRSGTAQDLHAELADVVITAYVTAAELDIDLDLLVTEVGRCYGCWRPGPGVDVGRWVLKVSTAVAGFVRAAFRDDQPWAGVACKVQLAWVVCTARAAASALDIDLDAAIAAKLAVVFTRGWRDHPAGTGAERPTLAQTRTGADWCAGCGVEAGSNRYDDTASRACCGTCGAPLSARPAAVHTVPCGLGCGYLADSEADLDRHENHECDHLFAPPPPRPVESIPRRVRRRQRSGGDQR